MVKDYSNENILEVLKSSWFIILFIGAIIVGWVRMEGTISDHEARLVKVEAQQVATTDALNKMALDLQDIKTTLLFIKEKLQ